MIFEHLLAITIAIVLDYMVGDPPSWPHPVKWIGTLISTLDKRLNKGRNRKWKGILMFLIVLVAVFVPHGCFVMACLSDSSFGRDYGRKHSDINYDCSQKPKGRGVGSV